MKIAIIMLGLFVVGCADADLNEESVFQAYNELIAAQEEVINLLETKVDLLEIKCNVGQEVNLLQIY